MWTYLFGPILALFPKAWRESLPISDEVEWQRATAISALLEGAMASAALVQWYSYVMTTWVANGTRYALSGKMGPEFRVQDIGAAALFIWWLHPITWLLGYACFEGFLRLSCAVFAGSPCGSLSLWLIDRVAVRPFRREQPKYEDAGPGLRKNLASYLSTVREAAQGMTVREVPDELYFTKSQSGEILEVRAYCRKQDWYPPRVVRYLDGYYRLESDSFKSGPRPYLYQLRRLPAGVPGRNVLLYAPANAVIRDAATKDSLRGADAPATAR